MLLEHGRHVAGHAGHMARHARHMAYYAGHVARRARHKNQFLL